MELPRALELMRIELNCVHRNSLGRCNRECASCDLAQTDTDLVDAYTLVIASLQAKVKVHVPCRFCAHWRSGDGLCGLYMAITQGDYYCGSGLSRTEVFEIDSR